MNRIIVITGLFTAITLFFSCGGSKDKTTISSGSNTASTATPNTSTPLTVIAKDGGAIAHYQVPQLEELKPGEWPAFIAFLSRPEGPILDQGIIEAKEGRRAWSPKALISISFASAFQYCTITNDEASEKIGYRFTINDTDKKEVQQGAILNILFDKSTLEIDWDWLGNEYKVSAAIATFKTEKKAFVFQRLLTPIASRQFNTGVN